jgi:hypothetical protein
MLQALIRVADDSSGTKRQGDVICVKLYEQASWGTEEIKYHQAVPWHDDSLEETMKATSDFPVFMTPYMIKETIVLNGPNDIEVPLEVCKTRSSKYFDINEIENEYLKEHIISNHHVVSADDIEIEVSDKCIKTKTETQMDVEFAFNKTNARKNIPESVDLN